MKYFKFLVVLVFLVAGVTTLVLSGDETSTSKFPVASKTPSTEELARTYPIAPGVWYPTDGPIPEKPIRYYRVRCWPGCHSGSDYGKYPENTLIMKPIHRTSALRDQSGTYTPEASTQTN
jgi:hypothetical protein